VVGFSPFASVRERPGGVNISTTVNDHLREKLEAKRRVTPERKRNDHDAGFVTA
jgi:hypothetical protein